MKTLLITHSSDIQDSKYEVLKFQGVLDSHTSSDAQDKLLHVLKTVKAKYLLIDLTDFSYVNSSGIGLFLELHMKCIKADRTLVMAGMQSQVNDVFEIVGLPKIIQIFKTVQEAIRYMTKN